jgi:deoxyhypusine synthase
VLVPTETVPEGPIIQGHDFNKGRDLDSIMAAMLTSGFQATALGQAVEEVNRMVSSNADSAQHIICCFGSSCLVGQEPQLGFK